MPTELIRSFPGAQANWAFVPSRPSLSTTFWRWRAKSSRRPGPAWKALKPIEKRQLWLVYFIYLTDDRLSPSHRFTLERLASEDAALLVICACAENHPVLEELKPLCSALYWKAKEGWDFSAYAVALTELARISPGADILVLNDSMFGPFRPLIPFVSAAPWRLTGFTGNAQEENHVQSYAFVVKAIDPAFVEGLRPVLSTAWSYNAVEPVILLQETRLARVAHHQASVGAYLFADGTRYEDLCLNCPELLLNAGFPLLKRALFGKFSGSFQDPVAMKALLHKLGHPMMPGASE